MGLQQLENFVQALTTMVKLLADNNNGSCSIRGGNQNWPEWLQEYNFLLALLNLNLWRLFLHLKFSFFTSIVDCMQKW